MINLSGPVQGIPKINDDGLFVFRVADTAVAVMPRKKKLFQITEKIKSGVWVTVKAESQYTSSGDHILDAKEIVIQDYSPKQ